MSQIPPPPPGEPFPPPPPNSTSAMTDAHLAKLRDLENTLEKIVKRVHPSWRRRLFNRVVTAGVVGFGLWAFRKFSAQAVLPDNMLLTLDLQDPIQELPSKRPFQSAFKYFSKTKYPLDLREVVEAINYAAQDDRVSGLVARLEHPGSISACQELKPALEHFQKHKWAMAFAETLEDQSAFYLSTAFKSGVALAPAGFVGPFGFQVGTPFLKGLLDKLRIEFRGGESSDIKSIVNVFVKDKYTEQQRIGIDQFLSSMYSQFIKDVASARNLPESAVKEVVDNGMYSPPEALTAKLVDHVIYEDQFMTHIKQHNKKAVPFVAVKMTDYIRVMKKQQHQQLNARIPKDLQQKIALVYAVGTIDSNMRSNVTSLWDLLLDIPFISGGKTGAVDTAFERAIADPLVKAIVLRVNSPGGSASHTDMLWRYVVRAQEAGKPVVASVGTVAASGGLYLISNCNHIIANPASILGSIGVGTFRPPYIGRTLQEHLGITYDEVKKGFGSNPATEFFTPPTEQELAVTKRLVSHTYDMFVSRVAQGRKMSKEQVIQLAEQSELYTGLQAKEAGLVDEIGGLQHAIEKAAELGNATSGTYRVVCFNSSVPKFLAPPSFW